MAIESLLLSRDADAIRVLRRILDDLGIVPFLCDNVGEATRLVEHRKFDAVIVDCDDMPGAGAFFRQIRTAKTNNSVIGFALTNGQTTVTAAFNLGANFVLDKPVSPERAARSFRAAHGLILRERRRYFRYAVQIPATLRLASGEYMQVKVLNLSEGGMATSCSQSLAEQATLDAMLALPDGPGIEIRCEVSWYREGRAGLQFVAMKEKARQEIAQWLAKAMQLQDSAGLLVNGGRAG